MRVERIVITGDVFRTVTGDPNQIYNVRWLHGELARGLYDLTGLLPSIRYRRSDGEANPAIIAKWFDLLGHSPSLEGWAATFGKTDPPSPLVDEMDADYDRALVIGFELSPLIRSILDIIGVPWIDIAVSPIRFLDDLALTFKTSWPVTFEHPGLLSRDHVREAVVRMRARYQQDQQETTPADVSGACVFLAQTEHDRTLIKNGAFYPIADAIELVTQTLNGRKLLVKPHPLAPTNSILAALTQRFNAPTIDTNIYWMLAAAADVHFLTISSSAAIEAQHFGHSAEIFHAEPYADLPAVTSLWAHRVSSFWQAALNPIMRVRRDMTFEEPLIPDRLRHILGSWGMVISEKSPSH